MGTDASFDLAEARTVGPPFAEVLLDGGSVVERVSRLARTCRCVNTIVPVQHGWSRDDEGVLAEILRAPGRRGRLLVDVLEAGDGPADVWCQDWMEVRAHRGPLRRMLLLDDRVAVLPFDSARLASGAFLLRYPLVRPCAQLFDLMWAEAGSAQPSRSPQLPEGLSERELEVAALLLRGATDDQVANRLELSARTVRTVVSGLHGRYGTNSRMALGYHLARAGVRADPTG